MESEGPSSDEADLRVERLDERVSETVLDGGDDRGTVFAYSPRQADELCDPTTLRPSDPSVECCDGTGSRASHRDAQSLLQGPGTMESWMRGGDVVESGSFGVTQVLGLLPERPARLVEDLALAVGTTAREVASSFAHLIPELATHEVEGVARPLHDVKGVRAHDGPRAALLHRASDPGCSVGADVGDCLGSLLAQQVEEGVQGTGVGTVGGVDQPASVVVDDHEQVAVVAPVGDLVDADARDALEQFFVTEIGDDSRDDLADRAPRAAQQSSGRRRGHLDRAPSRELLEGERVARTVARPGNRRDDYPVLGATHPRHTRDDEYLGASEVEGSPASLPAGVIAGAANLAVWAAPTVLDSGSESDLDALVDEIDIFHADALGVDAQGPG